MLSTRHSTALLAAITVSAGILVAGCDTSTSVDVPLSRRHAAHVAPHPITNPGDAELTAGEDRSASAWINGRGGMVYVDYGIREDGKPNLYGVWVPPNAVDQPTLFTVQLASGELRLHAWVRNRDGIMIDAGTREFGSSVYVFVSCPPDERVTEALKPLIEAHIHDGFMQVLAEVKRPSKYVMAVH